MGYFTNQYELLSFPNKSGRSIAFNSEPSKYAWLRKPRMTEMRQAIDEFVALRLGDIWQRWALAETSLADGTPCLKIWLKDPEGGKTCPLRFTFLREKSLIPSEGEKRKTQLSTIEWCTRRPLEEQKRIVKAIQPATYDDLSATVMISRVKLFLPLNLAAMLEAAGSVEQFMSELLDLLINREDKPSYTDYLVSSFLLWLVEKRWLLMPLNFTSTTLSSKVYALYRSPIYFSPERWELIGSINDLANSTDIPTSTITLLRSFLTITDVQCLEDFSPGLLKYFEDFVRQAVAEKKAPPQRKNGIFNAGDILSIWWRRKYTDEPFPDYREFKTEEEDFLRKSPTFKWVLKQYPNKPALWAWAQACAGFIQESGGRRPEHLIRHLNQLLDFFGTLPIIPPSPAEISRFQHIKDVTGKNTKHTLLAYLKRQGWDPKTFNSTLLTISTFFAKYKEVLVRNNDPRADSYKSPIDYNADRISTVRSEEGPTFRDALPQNLIDEIKKTIIGLGVENETDDPFITEFARRALQTDMVQVENQQTHKIERVWYPGTAICLFLLLDDPIRSSQARWLDDGEFDEFMLEPDISTGKVKCVLNPRLNDRGVPTDLRKRIRGRQQFALREFDSMEKETRFVGTFINTNKQDIYDGRSTNGYMIPYASPDAQKLIFMMRDWNRTYLPPLEELVPYLDGEGLKADMADKVPQISLLFRDPDNGRQHGRRGPISYGKLHSFYLNVLKETERRLHAQGKKHVHLVIRSVDAKGKTVYRPKYDLHSLRVTGITNLIRRGVSVEVVSQFVVGHRSLIMTLHYLKNDPGYLRDVLQKALEQHEGSDDAEFIDSSVFADNLDMFRPFLVGNDQVKGHQNAGFRLLYDNRGSWDIFPDGICPGGHCSTGFPVPRDTKSGELTYGQVPGGKTCSLCRYFITGPMFLLGQIAKANSLLYRIDSRGRERKKLLEEIRAAEADQKDAVARKKRARVRELDELLAIDLNDWTNRFLFALASSDLLRDYLLKKEEIVNGTAPADTDLPMPMLTRNSPEGMKIIMEETHRFAQVDMLAQFSEFITNFNDNEAILDRQKLLNRLLYSNNVDPFLLGLDDETALVAGNMLSSFLLKWAGPNKIEQLLDGTEDGKKLLMEDLRVEKDGASVSLKEAVEDFMAQIEELPRFRNSDAAQSTLIVQSVPEVMDSADKGAVA